MEERLEVEKHPSSVPKLKRSAGKEDPTFSKLVFHRVYKKKGFTYRGNSSAKVTTDAEESGNGSLCYRHPFERSDTSDKRRGLEANSPRKGEVWGRGGESQRERECELLSLFFISRPRPLCSLGQYRFIRRPFLFEPPFATLSFFLSFFPLPVYASHDRRIRFDSIPGHPRDPFFFLWSSVTAHFQPAYLCVQSSLFTIILPFLGRIVQFFGFHSFFFFLKTSEHASFFVAFDEIFPCI